MKETIAKCYSRPPPQSLQLFSLMEPCCQMALQCGPESFLEVARLADIYIVPDLKQLCLEKIAEHVAQHGNRGFCAQGFQSSGFVLRELCSVFKPKQLASLATGNHGKADIGSWARQV